jgi:hypothetical protein
MRAIATSSENEGTFRYDQTEISAMAKITLAIHMMT